MGIEWDTTEATAGLDSLKRRVQEATKTAAEKGGLAMVHATMETAPILTGRLKQSIYAYNLRRSGGQGWAISVAPHTVYARQRELGGPITVKRAKVLYNKETGQSFGRSVFQAGSHYFSRGLDQSQDAIYQAARQAWADAMEG